MLTVAFLIIIGGIGFLIWQDVLEFFRRRRRRLRIYTRLVLIITGALLLSGTVCFAFLEWNNPATLGGKSTAESCLPPSFNRRPFVRRASQGSPKTVFPTPARR